MKKQLFILMMLITPAGVLSQTKADYEHVMKKFVGFFNSNQADSICNLAKNSWKGDCMWTPDMLITFRNIYGNIKSCRYITIDSVTDNNMIRLFKIVATNKTFMLGLTLEKDNELGTFRFETGSPYIDEILKKN